MKKRLLIICMLVASLTQAQDTLTVMQYNLLYYGELTDWCTSANNNINNKDNYLKTIVNYVRPDIFTVNEISKSPSIHQHLLDQVLNQDGQSSYKYVSTLSADAYNIVNMMYYNSEKLALKSHTIAQDYIRDVDVYRLYYLSEELNTGDTTFLNCVVAHLKAGSGTSDENKRKVMATNTMNYLNTHRNGVNYLLMGDFNLYTSNEAAYQQFTSFSNPDIRFFDPINRPGNWNNNSYFSDIHTQSTHADDNGCASYGGMDDRFDFILVTDAIRQGSDGVKILPGSYKAVGQDGKHFNKSVNSSPTNSSVPSNVLNALYHNSDHLPVTVKLITGKNLGITNYPERLSVTLVNPVSDNIRFNVTPADGSTFSVIVSDLSGRVLIAEELKSVNSGNWQTIDAGMLGKGIYLLWIKQANGPGICSKMIKF